MPRPSPVVTVALALLLTGASAFAQTAGIVGGAVFVSPWRPGNVEGSASLSYENDSPDSVVFGVAADAGVQLGPRLQLAVEAAIPARGEIAQTHFYFNPFTKDIRFRETTVFGLARVALTPAGAVGVELVAGGGLVRQSSVERVADGRFGSTGYTFGGFGAEQEVTRTTWGVAGGLDLPFAVGARASIVPQARVIYVDRGDITQLPGFPALGLPDVTIRIGAGLRLRF